MHLTLKSICAITGISAGDMNALRRALTPNLKTVRDKQHDGVGRGANYFELSATIEWLNSILPKGLGEMKTRAMYRAAVVLPK